MADQIVVAHVANACNVWLAASLAAEIWTESRLRLRCLDRKYCAWRECRRGAPHELELGNARRWWQRRDRRGFRRGRHVVIAALASRDRKHDDPHPHHTTIRRDTARALRSIASPPRLAPRAR